MSLSFLIIFCWILFFFQPLYATTNINNKTEKLQDASSLMDIYYLQEVSTPKGITFFIEDKMGTIPLKKLLLLSFVKSQDTYEPPWCGGWHYFLLRLKNKRDGITLGVNKQFINNLEIQTCELNTTENCISFLSSYYTIINEPIYNLLIKFVDKKAKKIPQEIQNMISGVKPQKIWDCYDVIKVFTAKKKREWITNMSLEFKNRNSFIQYLIKNGFSPRSKDDNLPLFLISLPDSKTYYFKTYIIDEKKWHVFVFIDDDLKKNQALIVIDDNY